MTRSALEKFWSAAREAVPALPIRMPDPWQFGAIPDHADELLALVLDGTKTATASALWDIESEDEPIPQVGEASMILDGRNRPRAVIVTTAVEIVAFSAVNAAHAHSEGEGDRTLKEWREVHEQFWRRYGQSSRAFSSDMPVVCERFELVFAV
ncbi:ASCH domain-containing protein [Brevibacterium sp. UCMA 11754]|uniref:ASCH domain-containing protein n=1 Tax=Brevibacterium sp. UCMA 11754 TaxID=2749198 RepID=UPI001F400DF0|nr:ASCH domain-containing protein [Brevibacterium sp. UCMA 11754]